MARNGRINIKGLEDFRDKFQAIDDTNNQFIDACAKELAARLLAKVIKRTPVGDYPNSSGNS